MKRIKLTKKNESFLQVECEEAVHLEIREFFAFRPPNYRFHPAFKRKKWDGYMHLYDLKNSRLPYGLFWRLQAFAKHAGYTLEGFIPEMADIRVDEVRAHIDKNTIYSGDNIIKAYDHQVLATALALKSKRLIIESSTSSGKSLIAYELCSYLFSRGMRGLYVVPTVGLVTQLESDFKDYAGKANKKLIEGQVHKVYSGQDKESDKPLIVSTWQSLLEVDPEWFHQFDFVIVDEAHTAQAKSLTTIVEQCVNATYKFGMTGSLQDSKVHRLVLEGLFGPVEKIMTNREAIDKNIACDIHVDMIGLVYPPEDVKKLQGIALPPEFKMDRKIAEYQREIKFLMTHDGRNDFIIKLALATKKPVLILTQSVEHAKYLFEEISTCASMPERNAYLVFGDTSVEEREDIRQTLEGDDSAVIVATYGVFQQGISIKNIHYIIFASPSKSKIRVLQSIGRGLRLAKNKERLVLFDLGDDLSFNDKPNFAMKHFMARHKLYQNEKFKVDLSTIKIKEEHDAV